MKKQIICLTLGLLMSSRSFGVTYGVNKFTVRNKTGIELEVTAKPYYKGHQSANVYWVDEQKPGANDTVTIGVDNDKEMTVTARKGKTNYVSFIVKGLNNKKIGAFTIKLPIRKIIYLGKEDSKYYYRMQDAQDKLGPKYPVK